MFQLATGYAIEIPSRSFLVTKLLGAAMRSSFETVYLRGVFDIISQQFIPFLSDATGNTHAREAYLRE
jgi:hypothetical protein